MLTATGTSNMWTTSIIFFVFFAAIVAVSTVQGQAMGSCTAALKPVFTTTQGYQCMQLTITNTNFNTSSVTYSQGNLYFNCYFDGLVNCDVPSFPVTANKAVACNQGTTHHPSCPLCLSFYCVAVCLADHCVCVCVWWSGCSQLFSVQEIGTYLALNYFNMLVTHDGVLRLVVGLQVYFNVTLVCNNAWLPAVAFNQQGIDTC